jgi:hypothetical protein
MLGKPVLCARFVKDAFFLLYERCKDLYTRRSGWGVFGSRLKLTSQHPSGCFDLGRSTIAERHSFWYVLLVTIMRKYMLTVPKDDHGQPRRLFKFNFENNASKAIDQLSGICSGILADGTVTDTEAQFFAEYVRKFAASEPVWPFTDILARVERAFRDGVCDEEEREDLKQAMEALCGHVGQASPSETYSSTLPLDSPLPDPVVFPKHAFVITGRFAYGTRRKVFDMIAELGGFAADSPPTHETDYLVIGTFASRDWASTNYGRKIERAVQLRESGCGISIISEEHWKRFVAA